MSVAFHLALPVRDLDATLAFYTQTLGCSTGRSDPRWVDLNFFGHQVTLHLTDAVEDIATNPVDGDAVPVRHFGVILEPAQWRTLAARLDDAGLHFLIEPHTRFAGEIGEQSTLFVTDPSGNAIEFKSFAHTSSIFAAI
ncbi:MAG: VOC family protein [Pseudomonadota bacterium]